MTHRWLNIGMAIVFLIVGILATANTIRFNRYVSETLPRDVAQEQCNTETIQVLKSWIEARASRDNAMDLRDDAAVAALEGYLTSGAPDPAKIAAWRDAVANDRVVRAEASKSRIPLPDCQRKSK